MGVKLKHVSEPGRRALVLAAERNRKMATSAHAFVRGSTSRFYDWLANANSNALPEGPETWICGDCHVGNLGPVASTGGALAVQIRDLDQTVIGNPAHDLIRLGLSLAMASRGSDLPGVTTAHMLERMIEGYEAAFKPETGPTAAGGEVVPTPISVVLRRAAGRSWKHLADERIEGTAPSIPLGKRFWPLSAEEREAVDTLFADEELHLLVTSLRSRSAKAKLRVLDAAYWVKGCSSLGRLRLAVLVSVDHGKAERHCLIDIKEAVTARAPRSPSAIMPANNGERVVTGARNLSPFLGSRMLAARLLGKSIFVRELLPQDLKLEIEQVTREEAMGIAQFLAGVVGTAHARQLGPSDRARWIAELQRNRSKSLDAPSWLWNSVVDLVAAHEAAYLQHCRRYALDGQAA